MKCAKFEIFQQKQLVLNNAKPSIVAKKKNWERETRYVSYNNNAFAGSVPTYEKMQRINVDMNQNKLQELLQRIPIDFVVCQHQSLLSPALIKIKNVTLQSY